MSTTLFTRCPDGRVPGTCRTERLDRVARLVMLGLNRVSAAIRASDTAATPDPAEHARRAERLAQLYTRRARWWAVLERATIADPSIPAACMWALVNVRLDAEQDAAGWAERAAWWHERVLLTDRGDQEVRPEPELAFCPPTLRGVVA